MKSKKQNFNVYTFLKGPAYTDQQDHKIKIRTLTF